MSPPPLRYQLILSTTDDGRAARRLAAALKALLRWHGFRCEEAIEMGSSEQAAAHPRNSLPAGGMPASIHETGRGEPPPPSPPEEGPPHA